MKNYIDAASFGEMILCADAALHANMQAINELNVFPVPDGDTGTNMGLTLNNAAVELRKKSFSTSRLRRLGAAARGARQLRRDPLAALPRHLPPAQGA